MGIVVQPVAALPLSIIKQNIIHYEEYYPVIFLSKFCAFICNHRWQYFLYNE